MYTLNELKFLGKKTARNYVKNIAMLVFLFLQVIPFLFWQKASSKKTMHSRAFYLTVEQLQHGWQQCKLLQLS